jgi:hypothetical protein
MGSTNRSHSGVLTRPWSKAEQVTNSIEGRDANIAGLGASLGNSAGLLLKPLIRCIWESQDSLPP